MAKRDMMKKAYTTAFYKGKGIFYDFKKFITKGDVLALAVGIILGTAFNAIVNSMVGDIIGPILALSGSGASFDNLHVIMRYGNPEDSGNGTVYATVEQAKAAKAITWNYGRFLQSIIQFFLTALCLFIIVKIVVCIIPKKEAVPSSDQPCPFCKETVKEGATKCPHCTSLIPISAPADVDIDAITTAN